MRDKAHLRLIGARPVDEEPDGYTDEPEEDPRVYPTPKMPPQDILPEGAWVGVAVVVLLFSAVGMALYIALHR